MFPRGNIGILPYLVARLAIDQQEWSNAMKAKDVMTSPVVSIEPDTPVLQAVRIMLQRHISGLPVVGKDGRLVGIV